MEFGPVEESKRLQGLQRVDAMRSAWPLVDVVTARALEAEAQSSLAAGTLMQRAGDAIARLALAIAPHASRIWIAAGPGNNGGDGYEAGRRLQLAGKRVDVTPFGDPSQLPADAAAARQQAIEADVTIAAPGGRDAGAKADLVVDALLGLGSNRPPQGDLAAGIGALNSLSARGVPVLAVDLPSGLHPSTGQRLGSSAVNATHTLALLNLKPGLFTGVGRDHAGVVWLDALGTHTASDRASAWLSGGAAMLGGSLRPHAAHKGSFGDVQVIGGAAGMLGGALLAARTAHAAGAGRVYLSLLGGDAPALDLLHPELMMRPADDAALLPASVVCGCGGGDAVITVLPRVLDAAPRLVLDADALNTIGADSTLQAALAARCSRGLATVLTPHPLEAARLLNIKTADVQQDRLRSAQALADRYASVVVLKGSGSIIAAPGLPPYINPTGSAALATAGTGDVLAGWIGGRWAGDDQAGTAVPFIRIQRLAAQAVFRHGRAADGAIAPLRASELVERMHALG